MKLDKTDKKVMIIGFLVGTIANIFITKGIDIAMIMILVYIVHKYIGNIENYDIDKREVEYLDKESYFTNLKKCIILIDIYAVIKILTMLITQVGGSSALEIVLIGQFILIYGEFLGRKYIKSIDGVELDKKIKFANNKVLLCIGLIAFIGFTYIYNNQIQKEDNYMKASDYEYKLTLGEENQRIVELSGNGFYQRAEERDENTKHFDKYISDCKRLLNTKILEDYSKIAMVFMFLLAFSQMRFKKKNKKANTVVLNVILVGALVFGMVSFNTYSIDLEYKLITDFAEKGLY